MSLEQYEDEGSKQGKANQFKKFMGGHEIGHNFRLKFNFRENSINSKKRMENNFTCLSGCVVFTSFFCIYFKVDGS